MPEEKQGMKSDRVLRRERLLVSLVIPFYNEEEQIRFTVETVVPIMESLETDYEIIAVDDGSTDRTWEILEQLCALHPKLKGLRFSRNFGKEAAISAGLAEARGDAAILMDGDLQHDPAVLPLMVERWQEGFDVVDGVKSSRGKESLFSKAAANGFYHLFHRMSGINLKNASDYKLLDRKVIDAWNELPERDTFFRALSAWLGYRRTQVEFDVAERKHGKSKWNVFKLFRLSLSAVTGFSSKPLRWINGAGIAMLLVFLILGIQTLVRYFTGAAVEGFTTVILLLLFIGGAVLLALGLIGLYIDRIFREIKGRPRYLIAERFYTEADEGAKR